MIVKNYIRKIQKSEFIKYAFVLLSANSISQIISFAIYPIIARIYAPPEFGNFAWFVNIVGIFVILSTGRYDMAITLPKSEKKGIALFQLSLFFILLFFILSSIIVLFWSKEIAEFLNKDGFSHLLILIPLSVLLSALWSNLNNFFTRQKRYYNISAYNISLSIISNVSKCFFGIKNFLQSGLIWGMLVGQFFSVLISIIASFKLLKTTMKVDLAEIKAVAKEYVNFPKFALSHNLLNVFARNLPILILPFYFDMSQIGLFSLALTVGFTPVSLFSSSVFQVLYKKMAVFIQNNIRIKNECVKFCKICTYFILPFFILFIFIPEDFFIMIFGAKWEGVGFYFKAMLPWLFSHLLVASLSFIPDIFLQQKTSMKIEIGFVSARFISLLLGIYFNSFDLAIILYCFVSVLGTIFKFIWYFKLIKKYELSL